MDLISDLCPLTLQVQAGLMAELEAARKESDALRSQLSEVQHAGTSALAATDAKDNVSLERDLREKDKALAAAR